MDNDQDGSWLTLDEAAQKLGLSKDALRKRVLRGKLHAQRGNNGTIRVLVTSEMLAGHVQDEPGHVQDGLGTGHLLVQLEEVREQAAALARELAQAMERAARAEGRGEAILTAISELREALAAERARADRLEAALAEARRPWLARVIEGLKRKGS
jgi:regulator of protease activity HflC (stomatin/prohibitin superfamily)